MRDYSYVKTQIAEALDAPCGHDSSKGEYVVVSVQTGEQQFKPYPLRLRDCSECLPQRLADAFESMGKIVLSPFPDHDIAFATFIRTLRGDH